MTDTNQTNHENNQETTVFEEIKDTMDSAQRAEPLAMSEAAEHQAPSTPVAPQAQPLNHEQQPSAAPAYSQSNESYQAPVSGTHAAASPNGSAYPGYQVPNQSSWQPGSAQPYPGMPVQLAQKPSNDAAKLFFTDILKQIKGFFSVDPANLLVATFKSTQNFLWVFWLPLFLLLSPLMYLGYAKFFDRTSLDAIWRGAFGYTGGLGYTTGGAYLIGFLLFIFVFGIRLGAGYAAAAIGQRPQSFCKMMNLTSATLIPHVLFFLIPMIFHFVSSSIYLITFVLVVAISELLTFTLYQREYGLSRIKASNWLYLGIFAGRLILFVLFAFIWGSLI